MSKKVALALASLVVIIAASFAPTVAAQFPPPVEWDLYVTMGGQKIITVALEYGPMTFVLNGPFKTRAPWLKPYVTIENITFSNEIDLDGPGPLPPCVVFIAVAWSTPEVVHYIYSPEVGGVVGMPWLRITEQPLPGGYGVIYTVPGIADVDYMTYNNDTGTYWDPINPYGFGDMLAAPNPRTNGFLDPGPDMLPGFLPGKDDGFGDGIPDGKGASVLYLPEVFYVHGWNATAGTWDLLMGAPLMMTLTTGTAYDVVNQPGSAIHGMYSVKEGKPWEFLSTCLPWKDPGCNKKVTYAAAGSVMDYVLDPGPPRIALDILYDKEEKKVRADQIGCNPGKVVADISCDNMVTIADIAICTRAFGAWDEGLGPDGLPNTADDKQAADPRYDARADLDCNSLIDIFDLVMIAKDFGCAITPTCVVCPP